LDRATSGDGSGAVWSFVRCVALCFAAFFLLLSCDDQTTGFEGGWEVVGHTAPGISALSPDEAEAWVSTRAHFNQDEAAFGDQRCPTPTYSLAPVSQAELFRAFRVNAEDLGVRSDSVQVVEVECSSGERLGPGGTFILRDDGWMYTIWDGAFLELQPVPATSDVGGSLD